ncbi:1,2-phenylacetyl-CoA epoxidase subunit PaaC [Natrarchaeobius oligotrophus]|uniref:Phenylacetate-CoA oxygenase subunit PaaI n=1 Tax=Natrarchaeobius chitinivorans TaxID=1679083 RepID=A0A3N6MEW5_NATCH|nr:1,2-phenylacetyl-CoA epoxidase subunit PaaC [Natrarchaeobius chitinivorans]RQH01398.1 phenylacetate-CoA oxygenase subunit PaaI [Natrarchaeobius chitinivorans]
MAGSFEASDGLSSRERRALETLLTRLGDDEFVLAERYTEWQVRAPSLESDLALANNAQDELGHARLWYDVLADVGLDERALAYERDPADFRHGTLVELPFETGDWADAVLRSYLYDVAEDLRLEALTASSHPKIADRVGKIRSEEKYHREHARSWLERLAEDDDGRGRLQDALDRLFPHALTLFEPAVPPRLGAKASENDVAKAAAVDADVVDLGLRTATLEELRSEWLSIVVPFLESLDLAVAVDRDAENPEADLDALLPDARGRDGAHTEAWFDLHDELTRTYRELGRTETTTIMEAPDG